MILKTNTHPEHFHGFPRANGRAGIRNGMLVLSATGLTGPTARRIAAQVSGAWVICNPNDGGPLGDDRAATERALAGFITHPNVGAILLIGANVPKVERLAQVAVEADKAVHALSLDECGHDALTLTDRGVRSASALIRLLSKTRREQIHVSEMYLGLECGRSDPSSGLVANPLLGAIADRLIKLGGTAAIGETTEWLGADHLLAERAVNQTVAKAIRSATARRRQMASDAGVDLLGNNPGPTNIAAGLSTIEEKSLGNIAKSGSAPIQSVLGYGESPPGKGMYLMDAPAYAPESLTGFSASGAQVNLFTTGVGNSFVGLLAPTLKVSANPETTARLRDQIDIDASAAFIGTTALMDMADEAWRTLLDVASGTLTWGEILKEGDETIARFGESL
jgi:altronate dehydratase large subunit